MLNNRPVFGYAISSTAVAPTCYRSPNTLSQSWRSEHGTPDALVDLHSIRIRIRMLGLRGIDVRQRVRAGREHTGKLADRRLGVGIVHREQRREERTLITVTACDQRQSYGSQTHAFFGPTQLLEIVHAPRMGIVQRRPILIVDAPKPWVPFSPSGGLNGPRRGRRRPNAERQSRPLRDFGVTPCRNEIACVEKARRRVYVAHLALGEEHETIDRPSAT